MRAELANRAGRRALRVCMVHYSDFHADSRIQRQARALAQRGDLVELVCLSEPGELRCGRGRIRIHGLRFPKASGGASAYLRGYGRFLAAAAWRVSRLALRERLDLVEAHNMPDLLTLAALLPKIDGTPVILNVHDTFPELFASKFGYPRAHPLVRSLEREERLGAALADHVITVTEQARERLAQRGVGLGGCSVVMNAPDEHAFGPPRVPRPIPERGPVRVLYHGGLAPRFGVETLIRAFAELGERRLSLRICGSGCEEDRRRLAALARELAGDRISIAPHTVPFEQIPGELERAQIGVVPTLRDGFTELLLPVKLLEYAHMGLPVVASRLAGIVDRFGDDALWLAEPGSPAAIARALEAICEHPAQARERAARAGRAVAEISWARQRERYLELVDELVDRAAPRPARSRPPRLRIVKNGTARALVGA